MVRLIPVSYTHLTESDGRRWVTREPAIVYFHKKYWFNIIAMIRDNGVSYYCNLASPYMMDTEALKYIDYDLDVKVFADGEKRLLDVDEYEVHKKEMQYSADMDFILKENVKILVDWINHSTVIDGVIGDELGLFSLNVDSRCDDVLWLRVSSCLLYTSRCV